MNVNEKLEHLKSQGQFLMEKDDISGKFMAWFTPMSSFNILYYITCATEATPEETVNELYRSFKEKLWKACNERKEKS